MTDVQTLLNRTTETLKLNVSVEMMTKLANILLNVYLVPATILSILYGYAHQNSLEGRYYDPLFMDEDSEV